MLLTPILALDYIFLSCRTFIAVEMNNITLGTPGGSKIVYWYDNIVQSPVEW